MDTTDARYDALQPGFTAYDSDGDKIGDIEETGAGHVRIAKGRIFPQDLYVPFSAVDQVDVGQQAVFLAVTKDEAESMGWEEPPADPGAVAAGTTFGDSGVGWDGRSADRPRGSHPTDGRTDATLPGAAAGAVTGGVVGGAAAGPPGAIVGGAIGAAGGAVAGDEVGDDEDDARRRDTTW